LCCSKRFFAFFGGVHFPGGAHEIQGLALLIFRQFVEHVAEFAVAAARHLLRRAEDLVDGRPQGFRTMGDEQVRAVRRQTVITQVGEQALDRGSVFCRAPFDAQNVLAAFAVHAHRT
jgi:hypothetical protein